MGYAAGTHAVRAGPGDLHLSARHGDGLRAANIIVVGPVLVDVMVKAGYPDVQAALVVVVGFLIGSVTPPVGVAYFTAGAIAKARLESVAVAMLPYLVALFGLLFLLIVRAGFDDVSSETDGLCAMSVSGQGSTAG